MHAITEQTKTSVPSQAASQGKVDMTGAKDMQKSSPVFYQAKLTVGSPDDPLEHEADAMADKVMRMPAPINFSSSTYGVNRKCADCEKEEKLQRKDNNSDPVMTAPSIVHDVLNSSTGKSLDTDTRSFMEPRFNYNFNEVKIHDSDVAAKSAGAINALAYTSGNNIVFNSGQYNTNSDSGKRLLAHELTHVVQQDSTVQTKRIQRQADISKAPAGMPCTLSTGAISGSGTDFLFTLGSSELTDAQKFTIASFTFSWIANGSKDEIFIDGFASTDGTDATNWQLSCNRAEKVKSELMKNGVASSKILTIAHGETNQFGSSLGPNRIAILSSIHIPDPPKPKCGPDVSKWFVDQVNMAMKDPDVIDIKILLALAAASLPSGSLTTNDIAEGSAALATGLQENTLGSAAPARNATINSQLSSGAASGVRVASTLAGSSLIDQIAIGKATTFIGLAAVKWKSLVNHGAKYDFKAHVMNHPKSPNCPDEGCASAETGVVTICPGATKENCYESDLTGNIFYALIGRFIGWSELTLQLGSQLAELTDTKVTATHPVVTWDSPEDTTAIHLGFSLPLPLSETALCGAVGPARSSLSHKAGCEDCTELTTAEHT